MSLDAGSLQLLVSFHGPNDQMQGVALDKELRMQIQGEEEAALGKMRRFCAGILKKLAPPLLREIESNVAARELAEPTPRRITRAAGSNSGAVAPAPRKPRKVASPAETALLKALGISQPCLEVDEKAVQEFRGLFDSPVREQHLRTMAAIFGKSMPANGGDFQRGLEGGIAVQ